MARGVEVSVSPILTFTDRLSDHSFIERVWHSRSERGGPFRSIAAGSCELLFSRIEGRTTVLLRGPESRGTHALCPPEGEWLAVRLRVGAHFPFAPAMELRDGGDRVLAHTDSNVFPFAGERWEIPRFDDVEAFFRRWAAAGLVRRDPVVSAALNGDPVKASARTVQRRFLAVTGLTRGMVRQIDRARRATLLLRTGYPISDAGLAAGYFDQAHLTREVRRFTGLTPGEIRKGRHQLSFLYNTDDILPVRMDAQSGSRL